MHWIDLAIVGVIAWSAFSAFRRGLIREVISLASVLLGGVVAGHLYGRLAGNIDFMVKDPQTRNLVAFVAIYAGFIVLGQIAATLARAASRLLFLGPIDHFGGALFGLVQGVVLVGFLLFAVTTFPAARGLSAALDQSALAPFFLHRLPGLDRLLPDEFRSAIQGFRSGVIPTGILPAGIPGMGGIALPGGGKP
jgi:membrane protein required for colicin V production